MGIVLNTKKGTGGAPGSTPTLSQVLTAGADAGNKAMTGITTINGIKSYTAQITQTGTDDPVANVLSNTLGGTVVWTYSPSEYLGTLAGAFPEDKIIIHYSYGLESSIGVIWTSINTIAIEDPNDTHLLTPLYIQILIYP